MCFEKWKTENGKKSLLQTRLQFFYVKKNKDNHNFFYLDKIKNI